jgi:hypothetical protein
MTRKTGKRHRSIFFFTHGPWNDCEINIIDIGPFFGHEGVATGILARTRGCSFSPECEGQYTPEHHTRGPKIRANDIVILILNAQGQVQRA